MSPDNLPLKDCPEIQRKERQGGMAGTNQGFESLKSWGVLAPHTLEEVCCSLVAKSSPTLTDRRDPGCSVHGISQARILEWIAISFSRGSSQPRDWILISCIGRWILCHWATGKPKEEFMLQEIISQSQKDKYWVIPLIWSTQNN